jgi:biopolymer transport protein ExbB/TolQ
VAQRATSPIEFATHASERAAKLVHEELKAGLSSLATLATVAPFVGMFGTLVGIWDAPQPLGTERMTAIANLCGRLSNACVPTALGLVIGLLSHCGYRLLSGMLTCFDHEMEDAVLQVRRELVIYQQRSDRCC